MRVTEASATDAVLAEVRTIGDSLVIAVAGDWSLEQPQPRFEALVPRASDGSVRLRAMTFVTTELGSWDTSLLIFLVHCQEYCTKHELAFDGSALPPQVPRLLALANAVPERAQAPKPERAGFFGRVGSAALRTGNESKETITFAGEIVIALAGVLTRRVPMRWRDFWNVVQANSSGALPIVTLIATLMGVIITFLGVVVLERFGAGYYVSYLVGFGMLRELGALMTGIIIAGRTGAAFAAELGSMKISEEIDAFSTLGISPIEHLVLPRVLGIFLMMPLLALYADFIGIAGGMLVSATMLNLSFKQFMGGLLSAVTMSDALLGLFKATIFGFIVGLSGCMKGLKAGSDASAVGRAATSAVVLGITLIIMANAVVDWLAALLGI